MDLGKSSTTVVLACWPLGVMHRRSTWVWSLKLTATRRYSGINSLRWIGMGLLALTRLLAVVPLAFIVARSFSRPMREAVDVAKLVAAGNLTTQVKTAAAGEMGMLLQLDCRDEQSSSQPDQAHSGIDRYGHVDDEPDRRRGQAARKDDPRARQLNGGSRRGGQGDLGHQPRTDAYDG